PALLWGNRPIRRQDVETGQVAGWGVRHTPAQISRSRSEAHSRQRPQPAPTPSVEARSSMERAPCSAHSRTWRSVIALQRQMYMRLIIISAIRFPQQKLRLLAHAFIWFLVFASLNMSKWY